MDADTHVEVLYDFEYSTKDGTIISINEGEKLLLLKKTNQDWWQVIRSTGRPFYVPSTYVRDLHVGETTATTSRGGGTRLGSMSPVSPPQNFTVCVTVKAPPPSSKNDVSAKSSPQLERMQIAVNCEDTDEELEGSRYAKVPQKKRGGDGVAEAVILDDMSSSLAELAKEIEFQPKKNNLKYAGSFKTNYERKMPARSFSGSTPDLTSDITLGMPPSEITRTKSVEEIPEVQNINIPAPRVMGNNVKNLTEKLEMNLARFIRTSIENNNLKDSSDSVTGASSNESIDLAKPRVAVPVAKPRKIRPTWSPTTYGMTQDEAIYANCMEIARELRRRSPTRRSSGESAGDETAFMGRNNSGGTVATPPPSGSSLPTGWSTHVDTETQQTMYVHSATGDKWHSASDDSGRVYYFRENSCESSWTLPDPKVQPPFELSPTMQPPEDSSLSPQVPDDMSAIFNKISQIDISARKQRNAKAFSVIVPTKRDEFDVPSGIRSWPKISELKVQTKVLSEGPLHYTKISEGGKRIRKNWNPGYVVLTEYKLLIYKDIKAFHAQQKAVPELAAELFGAEVSSGQKISGRKHVLVLSTHCGLEIALQCENIHSVLHWATKIQQAIVNLPKLLPELPAIKLNSITEGSPEENTKKGVNILRSKSVNFKNKDDSMEDLGSSPAERQVKIKARLRKFFHKRPTMESLVKKGIWKDEPVFGTLLEKACSVGGGASKEFGKMPLFVQRIVQIIESSEENMKTDGLYRASGNLSQIQKIRLQIDQNNYTGLEKEEDIHVLTGTLKLFFRELTEPLIPYKLFKKAITASTTPNKKEKLSMLIDIVKALPTPNRDTLKFLLQHLLKVTQYQEHNRMHVANVAIVFGPTLMWPEQESSNMALDLMQQNMVIEALLLDYSLIFK